MSVGAMSAEQKCKSKDAVSPNVPEPRPQRRKRIVKRCVRYHGPKVLSTLSSPHLTHQSLIKQTSFPSLLSADQRDNITAANLFLPCSIYLPLFLSTIHIRLLIALSSRSQGVQIESLCLRRPAQLRLGQRAQVSVTNKYLDLGKSRIG